MNTSTSGKTSAQAQQDRLRYIDFRLYFLGDLRRADLSERFGIGPAAATRDIALYRSHGPGNVALEQSEKIYRPLPGFQPLFEHAPQQALTALSQGFGDDSQADVKALIRCEVPPALGLPDVKRLAPVTRAIHRGEAIRVGYTSVDSGLTVRELVPHALVNDGIRWHARAFDRKHSQFRDFVITRMTAPELLEENSVKPDERPEFDDEWNRKIELELVPHPKHRRPEVVRMDYRIPADGPLKLRVRAANVGYMLRRWNVDCTGDHSLKGEEFLLWLRDPLVLYGAGNAVLAPGYKRPSPSR